MNRYPKTSFIMTKKNGRGRLSLPVVMLVAVMLQGCASSGNFQQSASSRSEIGALLIQQRTDDYRISAGDQIEIAVWGYDEFNTERTVTGRGVVVVPLIGEVQARGQTKEEFTETLRDKLSEYIQGEINLSISITSAANKVVSVLGSVGRPDNYELLENASLFEVLSRAGGTTDDADLRNITIYRNGSSGNPLKVDLTRYLRGSANPVTLTPIGPGDIIYVPREENIVRELSTFMRDVVLLFGMFRIFS
jgi:polysaccharide biosynthesis/export protein